IFPGRARVSLPVSVCPFWPVWEKSAVIVFIAFRWAETAASCGLAADCASAGACGKTPRGAANASAGRSEEHTSELQSLMRISYAVFCLKKKNRKNKQQK